ncbi:A predicted alpha-helical domain with a conserved ER motif [Butyrivibrio fibrisolvens DSM 3071]|uniref:A predicted alpha-helical domain with a conserved ER motif n=1 Tax=Butyrivibrio fibrisolvens DSM 3071 TaxID=1121131 RepID=A0A1M5ZDJ8_BUTFI|nr:alpha-E domain-containing protein [Butyrivibrio fibrisolvens]SHI22276.1 A predicted alpha-helical domain with a conserved ER motif [Butyrivibrio fibrisolvens DSM 3071]
MGIISIENTDRLFWLGRYTERVYTTIKIFADKFDSMIDLDEIEYEDFCKSQDIPNIYKSKQDFIQKYCFSLEDENSIFSNLMRAYDNAIVLREEIGSESLSYIQLAVYAMNQAAISGAPLLGLQKVTDNIAAFWGMADDDIDESQIRNIIKVGKLIERIDIYSRLGKDPEMLRREARRLSNRIDKSQIRYSLKTLAHVNYLVQLDEVPYDTLTEAVERLVVDTN